MSKGRNKMMLFSPDGENTCRVIRRVGMEEALEKEALGLWARRYDGYSGDLMGFQMVVRTQDDSSLTSQATPAAISVSEMETFAFAGTSYEDANSRTQGRSEMDRLTREKSGRALEDRIERTVAKVLVWKAVGGARRDVLRVWPKGVSLDGLQRN